METLRKARAIFLDINTEDIGGEIFCCADNYETEWDWLINFIENIYKGFGYYKNNIYLCMLIFY